MTKFVYQFEPNGKDFFIKADNLKEAKTNDDFFDQMKRKSQN